MSNLTILRTYAQKADISKLPASVLFAHTASSLTIFDAYPKSTFHFLLLPRILSATGSGSDDTIQVEGSQTVQPLKAAQLRDLQSLLKVEKGRAKDVLLSMRQDAQKIKAQIEEEMIGRHGFKWDIYTGFHAAPSMDHLHLHILSADLCSPSLKHKKHYNSFHPQRGFFLHLEDVLSWFEGDDAHFSRNAELKRKQYEELLKNELECFHCKKPMKNMPTLKPHLQEEFDRLQAKASDKAKVGEMLQKKRKRDSASALVPGVDNEEAAPKRRELSTEDTEH